MKIALPYLFRRIRRLVEIPPALHAGDARAVITVNLKPKNK
jgi:hypothetical protein